MLSTTRPSYSSVEWRTCTQAFKDFVCHNGPTAFTFEMRPSHAPHLTYTVEGMLTLEHDALKIRTGEDHCLDWENLRTSIIRFHMPRNQDFLQAFEAARAQFSAEWALLEETESLLCQQYEGMRAQLQDHTFRVQQDANMQIQQMQQQMAQLYQEAAAGKAYQQELETHINQLRAELQQKDAQIMQTQSHLASAIEQSQHQGQQNGSGEIQSPAPQIPRQHDTT
ncbi:uncharacterized protein TM35_000051550, partial [Trypanosoma theileri]